MVPYRHPNPSHSVEEMATGICKVSHHPSLSVLLCDVKSHTILHQVKVIRNSEDCFLTFFDQNIFLTNKKLTNSNIPGIYREDWLWLTFVSKKRESWQKDLQTFFRFRVQSIHSIHSILSTVWILQNLKSFWSFSQFSLSAPCPMLWKVATTWVQPGRRSLWRPFCYGSTQPTSVLAKQWLVVQAVERRGRNPRLEEHLWKHSVYLVKG